MLLSGIANATNQTFSIAAGRAAVCMRPGENEGANTAVTIVSK